MTFRPTVLASALAVLSLSPFAARAEDPPARPAAPQDEKRASIEWTAPDGARAACLASRPVERVFFDGDEVARVKAKEAYEAARVRVLKDLYVVKVPSRGFSFGDYRTKDSVLPLDLSLPLRALHGAISLVVDNDGLLGFPFDESSAKAAIAAHKSGTDVLEVSFELDPVLGAPCSGSLATDVFVVTANVAMLELKDGLGKSLARVEGPAVDRHRDLLGGYSGTPAVNLGLVTTQDKADVVEAGRRLLVTQPLAKACYEKRIAEAEGLFGTLVFLLDLTAEGRIDKLVITADDVLDEGLRTCTEDAIRKAAFLGLDGLPARIQVPVEFKLVPKKK